jgi:hypothetical protein
MSINLNEIILENLKSLSEGEYADFNSKLIPNINREKILGVRIPNLRKLAKKYVLEKNIDEFMQHLPHEFYEENTLHAIIIDSFKIKSEDDYKKVIFELDRFLPFIDNWATCDSLSLKSIKNYRKTFIKEIYKWLNSKHTYTVRFAIGMLMIHYLGDDYKSEYLELVANIKSEEYYINMMIAWYMATALIIHYDEVVDILNKNVMPVWVHNKTIQKVIESFRITKEQKDYLRTLKRSKKEITI